MGEPGIGLAQQGIGNLKSEGSYARMPYWLSLLADLLASGNRPDAARETLDAALAAAKAHDDLWWLPEVMRMRAAYDEKVGRHLHAASAAKLASARAVWRCSGAASMTWPGTAFTPCPGIPPTT